MPIYIIEQDITKLAVDGIVNAANNSLLGGGGVDGAIHRAAGPELLAECRTLHGCETGEAKVTKGYHLPARYVIHTVGPIWKDGCHDEPMLLERCYRNCMAIARELGCKTLAFPLISAGVYGYPKDQALRMASRTIADCLHKMESDMTVYITIWDRKTYKIDGEIYAALQGLPNQPVELESADPMENEMLVWGMAEKMSRLLDGTSMGYKKANMSREKIERLMNGLELPDRGALLALSVAMELPPRQMYTLLEAMGHIPGADRRDAITAWFMEQGICDVFAINEALFAFDLPLLG